jgi:ribose/xylose/arabinose/galactoside ABC-type transport system permease subunit
MSESLSMGEQLEERRGRAGRHLGLGRYAGVVAGLVLFCVYLSFTQDVFLTWENWQNIFRSNAVVLILALGMTYVVITAGIDLSVASMTIASGMIFGLAIEHGWSWLFAVAVTLGFGLALGLANGLLIGVARISFFVVTLGTLSIYASIALLMTSGETISLYDKPSFGTSASLANGNIGSVPRVLALCAVLYAIGAIVLRYTRFGRAVYAVGSNPEAARLAGIKVVVILVSVYAISGLCAGMGAVVQTGRLAAAAPQVDPTLMLTVVAAVLIGGTAYTGGEGGLLGTVIGVFFLGVVQNGLTLSSVSSFWQGTVSGLILIVAVGLGVLREHGWSLRRRRAASREAPRDVQPADVEPTLVRVDADNAQLRSEFEAARLRLSDLERALARREGGGEVSRDP